MGFNIDFKIEDYKDILPDYEEYIKDDEILNYDEYEKGNIDNCFWKKQTDVSDNPSKYIREREIKRILKTGVWACIKDEIVWIPPNYYQFLQNFNTGGMPPQFRLKRLKNVYQKIRVRNNPKALGTYTVKNRQDGETTFSMSDTLWEVADGNMDFGQIGMQSKTRETVVRSCWRTLIMGWNGYPKWIKDELYSDFRSGDKVAETMKFMRASQPNITARDILISFGASTHNAFDSFNNMRKCILDEVNKWKECSFYATFLNYEKFIAAGASRKGLFDIFSSPSDENGNHNDEAFQFWKDSDPDNLIDGTTKSRVFRIYSNPLDGMEGMYDKFGDTDPEACLALIMNKRKNIPREHLMGEIRANPLNEDEMFGSFDGGSVWDNSEGIKSRKIYLMGRRYKDEETMEPTRVFGNLEWKEGVMDSTVEFRMADVDAFDKLKARWAFSHLPRFEDSLTYIDHKPQPPRYVESCLGIDPFNNRYEGKDKVRQSLGAAVDHKFRDILDTGINKIPRMLYLARPHHQDIFFEDMIKTAVFNRSLVQYENRSDKVANYFEDRGYFGWLLPEIGAAQNSTRKGDAPSGKGKFLEEGIALINGYTNIPVNIHDTCLLENVWFHELLNDVLELNPKDTHANDLTMAWIQALMGAVKIMHMNVREHSPVTDAIFDYLLG